MTASARLVLAFHALSETYGLHARDKGSSAGLASNGRHDIALIVVLEIGPVNCLRLPADYNYPTSAATPSSLMLVIDALQHCQTVTSSFNRFRLPSQLV